MSRRIKEQGFVEELLATLIVVGAIVGIWWVFGCVSWNSSEENVSGIVYNTSNDNWPSGNTYFSVRADVNTYVSKNNESKYCLPPNSPYKELVNKAASDKSVKVIVTTSKYFEIKSNPLVCVDNVKVIEAKK